MPWVRVDENAPNHPKFFRAGVDAGGFWLGGVCYCNRNLTDGFIPDKDLALLWPGVTRREAIKLTVRLVEAGLWSKDDSRGGYLVHDYHDYNPTAEDVRADREAARIRVAAQRRVLGKFSETSQEVLPNVTGSSEEVRPPRPDPARPIPDPKEGEDRWGSPEALVALWNRATPAECPAVKTIDKTRRRKAAAALKEHPALGFWELVMKRITSSDFLRGLNKTAKQQREHPNWVCTFDWLMIPGTAAKIHDGGYED